MIALARRPMVLARENAPLWSFAALLVAWGNVTSTLLAPGAVLPGGSWGYALSGVTLATVSLVTARGLGLDLTALGLRGSALRGATVGVLVGVTASLAGVAALRLVGPLVVGHPVDYAPLGGLALPVLLSHVAVLLPLGVVLPEELAFRGVLFGAIARARDERTAIAVSSILFALWHGAVVFATVADTTIGSLSPWSPAAVGGALVVVAVGGALFAWLRLATGTLATSIAAHWSFNAIVLIGLWWTR
jgi:membrane protease YdiL (CAAX protease family)